MRAVPPVRDYYSITTCEPLPQFSFVSYSLRILTGEKVDLELSSDYSDYGNILAAIEYEIISLYTCICHAVFITAIN